MLVADCRRPVTKTQPVIRTRPVTRAPTATLCNTTQAGGHPAPAMGSSKLHCSHSDHNSGSTGTGPSLGLRSWSLSCPTTRSQHHASIPAAFGMHICTAHQLLWRAQAVTARAKSEPQQTPSCSAEAQVGARGTAYHGKAKAAASTSRLQARHIRHNPQAHPTCCTHSNTC